MNTKNYITFIIRYCNLKMNQIKKDTISKEKKKKFLILRFSSMGDILLATPVIKALQDHFGKNNCSIDWIVKKKFANTLETNSSINKLYSFSDKIDLKEIREKVKDIKYDFIFDLHRNFNSRYITSAFDNEKVFKYNKRVIDRLLLVYLKRRYKNIIPITNLYFEALKKAGIDRFDDTKWDLQFEINDNKLETQTLEKNQLSVIKEKYIAFVPGASYETKNWPKEKYKLLAEKIIKSELDISSKIVIIGYGNKEEEIAKFITSENEANIINLVGKLTLLESAIIIKNSKLVISNDSGLLHLAEVFKKRVIAIFGSTNEELGFFPYSTDYKVIENKELKCRPCSHFGRRKCPKKHFKCMEDISVKEVFEAI